MAKIANIDNAQPGTFDLTFYCPGCQCNHGVITIAHPGPGPVWSFNNDFIKPTIRASVLVYEHGPGTYRCHFFVTDGKIQYLGDCTHKLAGQTVEMEDV